MDRGRRTGRQAGKQQAGRQAGKQQAGRQAGKRVSRHRSYAEHLRRNVKINENDDDDDDDDDDTDKVKLFYSVFSEQHGGA
ncbi:hypothetical protein M0804_011602 [Polistes exclamans]|nr:hypothetical protein M0804_011602 [Polistes exclamans]